MKTLVYRIRSKFWTYWYDKGYTYHQVLTRAYVADLVITNIITATIVYLVVR